ncbi:MAG: DUF427 domain-containing protein [Proteobacteria bacterium]|nr:DUF427 domain-containing protein [Pseudomonadota bacterium]NIS70118.1 DUF427 domain-containing protein [Pseudomonadota bacterium]
MSPLFYQSKKESVWDYPRPPRVEPTSKRIRVAFAGVAIADTQRALRVLETSHPPVYYIPPQDVRREFLVPSGHKTFCEFKGIAHYWTARVKDQEAVNGAWAYPSPSAGYGILRDHFAFYVHLMGACYVGNERAEPQPGGFYGGWMTSDIVGPFKGGRGTETW